jgi:hypothetical protein
LRRTLSLEILSSPIVEFKRSTSLRDDRFLIHACKLDFRTYSLADSQTAFDLK